MVIDGVVKQSSKHWTLVERTSADGNEYSPVVLMHEPSTASVKGLRKGDRVRLWGWIADESQTKAAENATKEEDEGTSSASTEDEEEEEEKEEDPRPAGLVFFAMDVDKATREFSGLEVSCQVADVAIEGSDDLEWEVTVEAKNKGDRPLLDLEVEANLVIDEVKTKEARDTTFVYFDRVDPGKTSTVKLRIPNWVEEEVEISGLARTLSGKTAGADTGTDFELWLGAWGFPTPGICSASVRPLSGGLRRDFLLALSGSIINPPSLNCRFYSAN